MLIYVDNILMAYVTDVTLVLFLSLVVVCSNCPVYDQLARVDQALVLCSDFRKYKTKPRLLLRCLGQTKVTGLYLTSLRNRKKGRMSFVLVQIVQSFSKCCENDMPRRDCKTRTDCVYVCNMVVII